MEVLHSDYIINDIKSGRVEDVAVGSLIWVIHADKIPPHIGISVNGKFFSLKSSGVDFGLPVRKLMNVIEKKSITTICFKLKEEFNVNEVHQIFNQFVSTIPMEITCLEPIKGLLSNSEAMKLTELLDGLYLKNEVVKVIGFNSQGFSGIQNYDVKDIHDRLKLLSNE